MRATELRDKSIDELKSELRSTLEQQFKLRMQSSSGQEVQTHLFRQTRRQVARIKTILKEKAGN